MKNNYLLVILLSIACTLSAQLKNHKLDSLHYIESESDEIYSLYLSYNNKGLLSQVSGGNISPEKDITLSTVYSYDNDGNVSEELSYGQYNDVYGLINKYNYTYVDNKLVETIEYRRNQDTDEWELTEKESSTYSQSNKILADSTFNYNTPSLEIESTRSDNYTYNTKDQLIVKQSFFNNIEHTRIEYIYDENDLLVETIESKRNTTTSEFQEKTKSISVYNDYKKESYSLTYKNDGNQNIVWKLEDSTVYKYDYTYDNLLEIEHFDFDIDSKELEYRYLTVYEIDYSKLAEETKHFTNESRLFKNVYTKSTDFVWNMEIEEYELSYTFEFFFSPLIISSLDSYEKNTTLLYPNPAQNEITILLSQSEKGSIELYNSKGERVWNQQISDNSATIDVSQLYTGFYTYRLITDKQTTVGKFVKD